MKTTSRKLGRPASTPIPATYDSGRAVTTDLGIPQDVLRAARAGGCQAFARSGRIDVRMLIRWWFSRPSEETTELKGRALFEHARGRREAIRLAEDEGRVIDREIVTTSAAKALGGLFTALDRIFASEFPGAVKGLPEIQIRKRALDSIEQLKADLRSEWEKGLSTRSNDQA